MPRMCVIKQYLDIICLRFSKVHNGKIFNVGITGLYHDRENWIPTGGGDFHLLEPCIWMICKLIYKLIFPRILGCDIISKVWHIYINSINCCTKCYLFNRAYTIYLDNVNQQSFFFRISQCYHEGRIDRLLYINVIFCTLLLQEFISIVFVSCDNNWDVCENVQLRGWQPLLYDRDNLAAITQGRQPIIMC